MNRRQFIGTSGTLLMSPLLNELRAGTENVATADPTPTTAGYPLMDLHVHRSKELTIEAIVEKSKQLNMKIGVMENIAPWGITNDSQLKAYIDAIKPYPVYIGLQPMNPGWSKNFSPPTDRASGLYRHGSANRREREHLRRDHISLGIHGLHR